MSSLIILRIIYTATSTISTTSTFETSVLRHCIGRKISEWLQKLLILSYFSLVYASVLMQVRWLLFLLQPHPFLSLSMFLHWIIFFFFFAWTCQWVHLRRWGTFVIENVESIKRLFQSDIAFPVLISTGQNTNNWKIPGLLSLKKNSDQMANWRLSFKFIHPNKK